MLRVQRVVIRNSKALQGLANHLCSVGPTTGGSTSSTPTGSSPFSTKAPNSFFEPTEDEVPATAETAKRLQGLSLPSERPDREISLLGPKDRRAALPGNIGIPAYASHGILSKEQILEVFRLKEPTEILTCELAPERQARILDQAMYPSNLDESDAESAKHSQEVLECIAHQCPELMSRDFQDLFPNRVLGKDMTVITICQKTHNSMTGWSQAMELERDELTEHFVNVAQAVSNKLNEAGFWADFIDPSSGRPYIGPFTNATLFETDERYRRFGFIIEDLGCCKVISHHVWGSKAFVGSLFTNAPVDSVELQDILKEMSTP